MLCKYSSQEYADRRNRNKHTEDAIRPVDTIIDQCQSEHGHRLGNRTAEVNFCKDTHEHCQTDCTRGAQVVHIAEQRINQSRNRIAKYEVIQRADCKNGENRNDDDRHDCLDCLRNIPALHPFHDIASNQCKHQCPEESGLHIDPIDADGIICQIAQNESRCQTRLACHGIADICRKDRNHHSKTIFA